MFKLRPIPFSILVLLAFFLKLSLFIYAASYAPEAKFKADTHLYLESGMTLISKKAFAVTHNDGTLAYVTYRTPGYPLFLGLLHGLFNLSLDGVVFVQLLLTLVAAVATYKTALSIDPALAPLSGLIILFDPATTIFSLMLLTESLFLLFISLFMFVFVLYLRSYKLRWVVVAALLLSAATYIRPVSYYLGLVTGIFIICLFVRRSSKKAFSHGAVFLLIVYSFIAFWHLRNYRHFHRNIFSTISEATISRPYGTGLMHSYQREADPRWKVMPPLAYYMNMSSRSLLSLFTRPASLKDFHSQGLKYAGKVFSYLWITFWMIGFLKGVMKIKGNKYYYFLLLIICYFTVVTVVATMRGSGPRFRVPMMPFIAVLSAYGWSLMALGYKKRKA